jgi:pyridoxine 5-phosphate synthase
MTKLSVNINKVALVRNSRGGSYPDLVQFALDCERFGAEGITVHPRPDQRHIRYTDIPALKAKIQTELNIEGYPSADFMKLVLDNRPAQCTLVPDPPGVLTSDSGWNTIEHHAFLQEIVAELKHNGIRTSLFLDPDMRMVEGAAKVNADRVEFYTGKYAHDYASGPSEAIKDHLSAARLAGEYHLGINAGHDLNLNNLNYYANNIPSLLEVSIGHAIICDSMYYGIQNVIQMYLNLLKGVK